MIKFFLGNDALQNSERLYDEIFQTDGRAYFIVPEQFTYENEKMLLSKGKNANMRIEVTSLKRLAHKIRQKTKLKNRVVLSEEAKSILINHVIETEKENLTLFEGVSRTFGFSDNMMQLFREMKKNCIFPDDLDTLIQGVEEGTLRKKLCDIKVLYTRYNEKVREEFIDSEDFFSYAAKYAKESSLFDDVTLFFDGFYSFDKSGYNLIKEIVSLSKDSFFTLLEDENQRELFFVTGETKRTLEDFFVEKGETPIYEKVPNTRKKENDLAFLADNVMTIEDCTYGEIPKNISMYEGVTMKDEVENAAYEITKCIKEKNYRYKDILVVVSSIENYAPLIERVFAKYDIPFFMDNRKEILYTSPVRALLFLLEMNYNLFNIEELIAYLKTGFSPLSNEEIFLFENYALEFGIKGYMLENPFTRNDRYASYNLIIINAIREKLYCMYMDIKLSLKDYVNTKDFIIKLYQILEQIGFISRIQSLTTEMQKTDIDLANVYAQIYNKIIAVLENVVDLFGEEKLSAEEIFSVVKYGFMHSDVGVIPNAVDTVKIADTMRSRGGKIKALFLLGANEGMLPKNIQNAGILSDEELFSVKKMGVTLSNTSEYMRNKERFLIYTLLTRPEESVYISRFLQNEERGEENPSVIFERISELFPKMPIQAAGSNTIEDKVKYLINPKSAFEVLIEGFCKKFYQQNYEEELDALYENLYGYFRQNKDYETLIASLESGLNYTNQEIIRDKASYRRLFEDPFSMSITKLEKYAACPFSFFVESVLRAREKKEFRVERTDIGSVLHKIVELYERRILEGEIDPKEEDDEKISTITQAICEDVLKTEFQTFYDKVERVPYLKKKLLRAAHISIKEITRQLKFSDFLLSEAEAKFSFMDQVIPICLFNDEGEEFYIKGVIDRVDTYTYDGKRYVRIIDYKTSKREFDISLCYYGLNIQLPVYLKAKIEQDKELNCAGIFYFPLNISFQHMDKNIGEEKFKRKIQEEMLLCGIAVHDIELIRKMDNDVSFTKCASVKKDGTLKKNETLLESEQFMGLLKYVDKVIEQEAKAVLDADIAISPYQYKNRSACTYCKAKSVCKFSESFRGNTIRKLEKKSMDDIIFNEERENALYSGTDEGH